MDRGQGHRQLLWKFQISELSKRTLTIQTKSFAALYSTWNQGRESAYSPHRVVPSQKLGGFGSCHMTRLNKTPTRLTIDSLGIDDAAEIPSRLGFAPPSAIYSDIIN